MYFVILLFISCDFSEIDVIMVFVKVVLVKKNFCVWDVLILVLLVWIFDVVLIMGFV